MLGARIGRREQKKDEINRPVVDGLIVEGLGEAREQAVDPLQSLYLAVGDCDSLAESRRAQLFPFRQAGENRCRTEVEPLSGEIGQLLQKRLLASARQGRLDRIKVEEIRK